MFHDSKLGIRPVSPAQSSAPAAQTTSPVILTSNGSTLGSSTLTRASSGTAFSRHTTGLTVGDAVTVWWMVANPDGGVAVLYAAGHVIGDGDTVGFAGYLPVDDSAGWVMGDDTVLEDALAATVTLVVRDHGPATPDMVNNQIHTFGACNTACHDLQISTHTPS